MGIGRRLRTFRQLTPEARRVVFASLPAFLWIGIGLRGLGLVRVARWVLPPILRRPSNGDSRLIAAVVTRVGGALPWGPRCLERSLVLGYLLRRRGHDAQLKIGVRKRDSATLDRSGTVSGIEAHAWIEVGGAVVGDDPGVASRFEVFEDLDLSAAALSAPQVRVR